MEKTGSIISMTLNGLVLLSSMFIVNLINFILAMLCFVPLYIFFNHNHPHNDIEQEKEKPWYRLIFELLTNTWLAGVMGFFSRRLLQYLSKSILGMNFKYTEYLKDDMELKANVDLKNQNVLITLRTGAAGATVLNAKSTSKVKGKDKSKNQALSDEPIADLSFMNKNQLQKKVLEKIKDLPEENADIIVEHMLR